MLVAVVVFLPCMGIGSLGVELSVSAESAIVMIAETQQVVYEKNAYEKRGIASTTKIMSSIIAIESGKLHYTTTVKAEDVSVEGTSSGLKAGDRVSLLSLVKGMLLSSGNDAANVTATMLAGDKQGFAELMNNKARVIGMKSTNFVNPSGLTEDSHYSTAYDMALLGSYAVKNSVFTSICSMQKCEISYGERGTATLCNHNKFLNMLDGAIGIKTGFTKASGRCLVTAVRRDGVTLVCVTLNAPDDWSDHKKLLENSFDKIQLLKVDLSLPLLIVVGSNKDIISTTIPREIIVPYVGEKPDVDVVIFAPHFLYSGVNKGDVVGSLRLYVNGVEFASDALLSNESAVVHNEPENKGFIEEFKEILRKGLS